MSSYVTRAELQDVLREAREYTDEKINGLRRDMDDADRRLAKTVDLVDGKLMVWANIMEVAQRGFRENHEEMGEVERTLVLVQTSQAAIVTEHNEIRDTIYGNAIRKDAPESLFGMLKRLQTTQDGIRQTLNSQAAWIENEMRRRARQRRLLMHLAKLAGANWKTMVLWTGGAGAVIAAIVSLLSGGKS